MQYANIKATYDIICVAVTEEYDDLDRESKNEDGKMLLTFYFPKYNFVYLTLSSVSRLMYIRFLLYYTKVILEVLPIFPGHFIEARAYSKYLDDK